MGRTVVCSDIHDRAEVLDAIVDHSGLARGTDRLIIAGDLPEFDDIDGEVYRLAVSLGAEILLGNHEAWFLHDVWDPAQSLTLMRGVLDGHWKLAESIDGVLITHAGVTHAFAEKYGVERYSAEALAKWLNRQLLHLAQLRSVGIWPDGESFLESSEGPVWYRPSNGVRPLAGITQVAGHTVPGEYLPWSRVAELEEAGYFMIDPGVRYTQNLDRVHARYAVIESGAVLIVDEYL
jgi:hypothetical protein